MDVIVLGAGKPSSGVKPTALALVTDNTRALDWQVESFKPVADENNIHFLGGYNVSEIINSYPHLNVTVVPEWSSGSILETLFRAPFSGGDVLISYSDTLFRAEFIESLTGNNADVVFGIDSKWLKRYTGRSEDDIASAETIEANSLGSQLDCRAEFTGLLHLKKHAARHIFSCDPKLIGSSLLAMLENLEQDGFSLSAVDVEGDWAEFNSANDIAHFILGTKADSLARLAPLVKSCVIGDQVAVTVEQWRADSADAIDRIKNELSRQPLVIRSSSTLEDNWTSSNAGGFESLLNVDGGNDEAIGAAIETVVHSYGDAVSPSDQVLIQPFLDDVAISGVIFTCSLESGAPYYRFNFDDKSSSTDSVTSGTGRNLRTIVLSRSKTQSLVLKEPKLIPVLEAVEELEGLLGYTKLDIEFAVGTRGTVHIFQVRPITVDHSRQELEPSDIEVSLCEAANHFTRIQAPPPQILGDGTILANMPDWNPAEIIGTRPRPLALSLYRYLITDDIWAVQRAEFGYRDVRPLPLISCLAGQPYVDVRASLNSFVPAGVPDDTAERLVNAYLQCLRDTPAFHDKIEFEIAFTIWTPDFPSKAEARLQPYGVTARDIKLLGDQLKLLTKKSLERLSCDINSVEQLSERRLAISKQSLSKEDNYRALLADCRRFGTLAFAHAARAGFVGGTVLRWMVSAGVLSEARKELFLRSFNTVSGDFDEAKRALANGNLRVEEAVAAFGHLRPGTYDITQLAYWEDQDKYFSSAETRNDDEGTSNFQFTFSKPEEEAAQDFLNAIDSELAPAQLVDYIQRAIQAREWVKFEFSKNLSLALDAACKLGNSLEFSRDDMSFLHHEDLLRLCLNQVSARTLPSLIQSRKHEYQISQQIELPPVIYSPDDMYCFERMAHQPNFVTAGQVQGQIASLDTGESIRNKIVIIPQADPGYDWLFGEGIGGLITEFGGANSHMAIRAAEMGLPAAIGVGEALYERISGMQVVLLDCANQTILEIK